MNAAASRMCELVDNAYSGEWLVLGAVGGACICIGWVLSFVSSAVHTRSQNEDK